MYTSQITDELTSTAVENDIDIEEQVAEILLFYNDDEEMLIPILQEVQQQFGYLPERAMKQVAGYLHIPESSVFGVATFYAFFKLVPTGRNIVRVCRGTACHVRGGARILKEVEKQLGIKPGESTPDLEYCLETVACIGACALAPTMTINDKTYGQMTPKKVNEIFKSQKEGK
jgi:NADH-quinone oxidoreductase subunit E